MLLLAGPIASAPVNMRDIENALWDVAYRVRLGGADFGEAAVRFAAVVNMQANLQFSDNNNIPQWAVGLQQDLAQLQAQHRQHQTQMQAVIQQMETDIGQMRTEINLLRTHWQNFRAIRHNACCVQLDINTPWIPLCKTVPGQGPSLPGSRPIVTVTDLDVGDPVPDAYFPANLRDLLGWSDHQINRLSMILNETFGIAQGDDPQTRRRKLHLFLAI